MKSKKYYKGKRYRDLQRYIGKIDRWTKGKYWVSVLGKRFIIYPTVFSPKFFRDSEFFARELPINKGEKLLEIGCGSGIVSICAVGKGAGKVVCVDINPVAVKNTERNAGLHGMAGKIRVLHGDVYNPLLDGERFDSIFWNTPWGLVKKKRLDVYEQSLWDTEYRSTERFIAQSVNHLKARGRLLIGFSSTIGDLKYLALLLKKYGFRWKIVKTLESRSVNFSAKFEIIEARRFR
jgi:HemK-related putative methylase